MIKCALLPLIAVAVVSANDLPESINHQGGPDIPYDYSLPPPAGNTKCALINVAMDESGSMENGQNFMQTRALPQIISTLYTPTYDYDHVFVCSNGFGYWNGFFFPTWDEDNADDLDDWHDYRFLGCSRGNSTGHLYNSTIVDSWVTYGGWEEGYYAMTHAMDNVNRYIDGVDLNNDCSQLHRNMILVTDEDRDSDTIAPFSRSLNEMKADLENRGYITNVVVDAKIEATNNNVGLRVSTGRIYNDNTIFTADGSGGYTIRERNNEDFNTFVTNEKVVDSVGVNGHYIPLVVDTPGATWNINVLRDNTPNLVDSFTKAFVEIKVAEIAATTPAPTVSERPSSAPTKAPTLRPDTSEVGGDPHITTWAHEHYEYHGECDLVMLKDATFANDLGIAVHIRTKIVRFWSYIQNVAIRIGNDILEIEGSAEGSEPHYWINYEYQGDLEENPMGGMFPITQHEVGHHVNKREYKIDLSSLHPGLEIAVHLYKEFVRVKFSGNEEVFGRTVGLMGNYKTGKTFGRDGVTVMNDFVELGDEWQVLPSEPKLFRSVSHPQFPHPCLHPEDARGDRKRRLSESKISVEQAEKACSSLEDPLAAKDCVYDVLATQDLGMIGAF